MPTYRGLSYFVYTAMEGMLRACNAIKAKKRSQLALTIRKISASSSYTAMVHFVTNDWVVKDSSEILVYL